MNSISTRRNDKKILLFLSFTVTFLFIGASAMLIMGGGSEYSFIVANLGVKLTTAQAIAEAISSGLTVAQIIGLLGLSTGVGAALYGLVGMIKAIIKKQGMKFVVNF